MNKTFMLIILFSSLLILSGCTKTIDQITADDSYIDSSVSVKGTVQSPLKLGSLSGYTLVDKNDDKILVNTADLPDDGDTVVARGTLKKGLFGIGYYIDEK